MTHNFCTIFDSAYFAKGLAMIQSLKKHSPDAQIHVLAMDSATNDALTGGQYAIYGMIGFEESTGIRELRETRTHQEYCWTVGSVFTDYVMSLNSLDELTYLDADTFFFSDPEVVFAEIGEKSIGITPHRFAPKDEPRLLPNGKYAVQWVTFKGEVGRKCLSKWAGQVRDWCYYRHEDGKFADQKYLDTWVTDYPGEVCEIANPGVGLAPWNIANYNLLKGNSAVFVNSYDGKTLTGQPLVMYHFHEYLHGKRLTNWKLRTTDVQHIYVPYAAAIESAMQMISKAGCYSSTLSR